MSSLKIKVKTKKRYLQVTLRKKNSDKKKDLKFLKKTWGRKIDP